MSEVMSDRLTCAGPGCTVISVPPSRCVASPRLVLHNSSRNKSTMDRLMTLGTFAFELVAGDLFPFLFQCDGCQKYFCKDCAAEILGELRFCPTCTGTSVAMSIILSDPVLRKDGNIWRHVGEMLDKNETIDLTQAANIADEWTLLTSKEDDGGVEELAVAGRRSVKSFSKIDCLAKALELQPTRRYWGQLAAAMEWGDHVTIHVADQPHMSANASNSKEDAKKDGYSFLLSCQDVFTIALQLEPFNATIWCNLAIAMPSHAAVTIGSKPITKLQCFDMALELDPKNETATLSYALALWGKDGQGRLSQASFASPDASVATMHTDFSFPRSQGSNKRLEEIPHVLQLLKTALTLNPTSHEAWSALGVILESAADIKTLDFEAKSDSGQVSCLTYVKELIGVDTTRIDCITAFRMAASLQLTEAAIFQLGMCLKSGRSATSSQKVCESQVRGPSGEYLLTRQAVLESLAVLHDKDPKRYPLSSGRKTFAITSTCPSAPSVLAMNRRCLLTHMFDQSFQPSEQSPRQSAMADTVADIGYQANSSVEVRLCVPLTVRHMGSVLGGEEYMYSLRVRIPCKTETSGDFKAMQVPKLVIGSGQQGCVFRAVIKDPSTAALSFMAAKVFLYIPEIELDINGKQKAADTMLDVDFEELIDSNGDLKFLLSDSLTNVVTTGRYAIAVDLSDPMSLATRMAGPASPFEPGKFAVLPDPIHSIDVPLLDRKQRATVLPRPFLVLVFMDRALFDVGARCANRYYTPLPKVLFPKVMQLASTKMNDFAVEKVAGAPTFDSSFRFMLEAEARYYIREVTRHLSRLHNSDCVHNDIKPENILVMPNGDIRLADFGVSRRARGSIKRRGTQPAMATLPDAAQEDMEDDNGKGTFFAPRDPDAKLSFGADDIWALGQTLRYLLTSLLPCNDDVIDPADNQDSSAVGVQAPPITSTLGALDSTGVYTSGVQMSPSIDAALSTRHDLIEITKAARRKRALQCDRTAIVEPDLSESCESFLRDCLCQKAKDRKKASELLMHSFLGEA